MLFGSCIGIKCVRGRAARCRSNFAGVLGCPAGSQSYSKPAVERIRALDTARGIYIREKDGDKLSVDEERREEGRDERGGLHVAKAT